MSDERLNILAEHGINPQNGERPSRGLARHVRSALAESRKSNPVSVISTKRPLSFQELVQQEIDRRIQRAHKRSEARRDNVRQETHIVDNAIYRPGPEETGYEKRDKEDRVWLRGLEAQVYLDERDINPASLVRNQEYVERKIECLLLSWRLDDSTRDLIHLNQLMGQIGYSVHLEEIRERVFRESELADFRDTVDMYDLRNLRDF